MSSKDHHRTLHGPPQHCIRNLISTHPSYILAPDSFPFFPFIVFIMGDVAVENPANNVTPLPKPSALDALGNLDTLEGTGVDGSDEYASLKRLQRHLEYA
jgi:hypothetical protein